MSRVRRRPQAGARRSSRDALTVIAAAGALLFGAALPAQGTDGAIAGRVLDAQNDSAVAYATVLVEGTLSQAVADGHGSYHLEQIAPGRYRVRVLSFGYRSAAESVTVTPGATARVDFALQRATMQLAAVTVTAGRGEREIGDVPASQAVLGSQEITRRNVITLDQALRYVPGVQFNSGNIDIRGSTGVSGGVGSRVLVLMDGHPVLTADGGEVDFSSLPLLDLDRVEVVKGAYSALYGSNALGGVVNIITKPIGESPRTTADFHYGAYDVPSAFRFTEHRLDFSGVMLQHERRVGDVGVRLAADRETSDGFREDDNSSRWLLNGRVDFPAASDHPSSVYAIWSQENYGNFFMWESPDHPYEVPPATINDWSHNTKLSVGATTTPLASGRARLRIDPYFERDLTQDHFPSDTDYHYHRAWKLGSNVQLNVAPSTAQTLTFGGEAAYTSVTSDVLGTPAIQEFGLYAQDEAALSGRVNATAGARLDTHHSTGSATEVTVNPKLGVVYHPTGWLGARASLARGYRGPSAIEQFVNTVQFGFRVVPNPDLHGETSWSGEVGVTMTPERWLWVDAALFQSDYHDLIGPAAAPGQLFVFQFRNTERARVRGLDLATKVQVVPRLLDAQVSYLFLDTKDLETGEALPYRSAHNVTGSLNVLGGAIGVDVRYRSRVQRVLTFPLDPRGAFTVVDLRLGYEIKGALLQAKASNLFQAKYVDVLERTPGAPRSLLFSVRRSF